MRRAKLPKSVTALTAVLAGTAAVLVPGAAAAADVNLTVKASPTATPRAAARPLPSARTTRSIVHFDTKADDEGNRDISINSIPAGLAAFRKLAANPIFKAKLG